jgi:hypothetical protein
MGMFTETDTGDIEAYCPGLDCAVNCHLGLLNVGKSFPIYDEANLHRSRDPGAGSFTPYHNGTTSVIRDIPAGGELFKDYGPDWFTHRYHIFGEIPFSDNYDDARELLQSMMKLPSTSNNSAVLNDLYQLMRGLSKKELFDSRTLNALPQKVEDAIEATKPTKDLGTILQPSFARNISFLNQLGRCLDHIVPKPSTIQQAARGAFAVRRLPKGTVVTASPLHHVPYKNFADMFEFKYVDGQWIRALDKVIGKQLVFNYCFSHPETTLLLCPYGSQINYINHDRERANVRVRWAENFAIGHNQSVVDHADFDFLRGTERPTLAFDYVATKDIDEGDEIFLDYGDDWIRAWDAHVATFKPLVNSGQYISADQWEKEKKAEAIRTEDEQLLDPYPEHLEIRCHSGLMNTDGAVDFQFEDYGMPCRIKSRDVENGTFYYTVLLVGEAAIDRANPAERSGVPRGSIRFFNRPATSDIHLPNAFRHPIGIPDDILPVDWRNIKADDVIPEHAAKYSIVDGDLYDDDDYALDKEEYGYADQRDEL